MNYLLRRISSRKKLYVASFVCAVVLTLIGAQVRFNVLNTRLSLGNTASADNSLIGWHAFNGGGQRNAYNPAESALTTSTVSHLAVRWQVRLPAVVDGTPIELPYVSTARGIQTLIFVTTKTGSLLAISTRDGSIVWRQDTHGPNITTSSPAIDREGQYVYSYGLDGYVHRYAVGNGAEYRIGGWPVQITLTPSMEKGSSSLNFGNGYLYVTTSGYNGDGGHYDGHVVAINIAKGVRTVFNVLCANLHELLSSNPAQANYCASNRAGVWARAGAVIDPADNSIFITSGNGNYNANQGGHDYGDTVIKLSPDLTQLYDTYTPSNYPTLEAQDLDLGSASPVMIPRQYGHPIEYLAVQAGKDNTLRLLNRSNLSGQGGPNHMGGELQAVRLPQGCDVDTHPTAWIDPSGASWVFVANDCGFSAFKIAYPNGQPALQLIYTNGMSGSSPFIANNVLYLQSNGIVRALEPMTGKVLWSAPSGPLHWQSPLVVNYHLLTVDNNGYMTAYTLH